jgi:CheY-like chemotaxis protein
MIMDVHLRSMDGLEALCVLRQDAALKDLCVIMTSGSDLKDQCLQAGANAFLMKPFIPDTLISLIKYQLTIA